MVSYLNIGKGEHIQPLRSQSTCVRESGRLARRLGLADAVFIGLLIASMVTIFNAMSSAQLASLYPVPGGTHVYAGKRLGV